MRERRVGTDQFEEEESSGQGRQKMEVGKKEDEALQTGRAAGDTRAWGAWFLFFPPITNVGWHGATKKGGCYHIALEAHSEPILFAFCEKCRLGMENLEPECVRPRAFGRLSR